MAKRGRKDHGVRSSYKSVTLLIHPDLLAKYDRLADLQRTSRLEVLRRALECFGDPSTAVVAHLAALTKLLNTMGQEEYGALAQEIGADPDLSTHLRGIILGLGTLLDGAFARLANTEIPQSDREAISQSLQVLLNTAARCNQRITALTDGLSSETEPASARTPRLATLVERMDDIATCVSGTMDYIKELARTINRNTEDLTQASEHITALEEATRPLQQQMSRLTEAHKDLAGKLGGMSLILERRLEAVEDTMFPSEETDDPALQEARQRGRAFLAACEKDVVATMAERISKNQDA